MSPAFSPVSGSFCDETESPFSSSSSSPKRMRDNFFRKPSFFGVSSMPSGVISVSSASLSPNISAPPRSPKSSSPVLPASSIPKVSLPASSDACAGSAVSSDCSSGSFSIVCACDKSSVFVTSSIPGISPSVSIRKSSSLLL